MLRVIRQLYSLADTSIKPGVNLLVSSGKIDDARAVYRQLRLFLNPDQIIIVPRRLSNTPESKDIPKVADGQPFQSPSCLLGCKPPEKFCSVSWDKKVNHCSYAGGRQPLTTLDYRGLVDALSKVSFKTCHTDL